VYTAREIEKLDVQSRGLLIFLEQIGVLDRNSRELVIDRIMALEADDIDIDRVKWVILMVLFNQGGLDSDFLWTEYLVKGELEALH
jgi:Smg protein